jgi:hypothetical protein
MDSGTFMITYMAHWLTDIADCSNDAYRHVSRPSIGHCDPEPGAGPVESQKEIATFFRRALKEAELQIELWKEQADEARKESIQLKSSVKVLHAELNVAQKELGQAQDEHKRQTELVMELRAEIGELEQFRDRFRSANVDGGKGSLERISGR